MKQYKFYGTISFSGYVVIQADNEMDARRKVQHNQFSRIEIPTLDRHLDFVWDNEDCEEIVNSKIHHGDGESSYNTSSTSKQEGEK